MNRIWTITFLGIILTSLGLGYWTKNLGIWTEPANNVWGATIVLAFAVPFVFLLYSWNEVRRLNNLIGTDHPGRPEEYFKRMAEVLCRRWNGQATINLISLRLISDYDLRKQLLKHDNYTELLLNLLKVNRFNFAKSEHSHMDCIDEIRSVILETEVARFTRETTRILEKPDQEAFWHSATAFIKTELSASLCILGVSNRFELTDQTMRIFDRLDPKQHNELLSIVEQGVDLKRFPTTGRGENVRNNFSSILREIRGRLAEKYTVVSA